MTLRDVMNSGLTPKPYASGNSDSMTVPPIAPPILARLCSRQQGQNRATKPR